ncbi:MAG: hypothetical protein HQK50_18190 [Oligoflexia bacterium]|nr:hypothetical protein [Oligoflexia bacterium]
MCDITESLSSQKISEPFKYLGGETTKRFEFSKLWAQKQKDNKFISVDLTSISSYSKIIESVEWGYNRDKEKMPQINLAFTFAQPSSLPIFYNVYRGSIRDVSTPGNILKFVNYLKLKNFTFVLDKGFWSTENIIEIQKTKENYIIPLPFSTTDSYSY